MAVAAQRVPMTVRLKPEDKILLVEKAEECGLDAGVAMRSVLELMVKRMRSGADFVDALHELKNTWRDAA